eukprot:m51a1_g8510 hypothetical protein (473) ;mRNA; r:75582-77073
MGEPAAAVATASDAAAQVVSFMDGWRASHREFPHELDVLCREALFIQNALLSDPSRTAQSSPSVSQTLRSVLRRLQRIRSRSGALCALLSRWRIFEVDEAREDVRRAADAVAEATGALPPHDPECQGTEQRVAEALAPCGSVYNAESWWRDNLMADRPAELYADTMDIARRALARAKLDCADDAVSRLAWDLDMDGVGRVSAAEYARWCVCEGRAPGEWIIGNSRPPLESQSVLWVVTNPQHDGRGGAWCPANFLPLPRTGDASPLHLEAVDSTEVALERVVENARALRAVVTSLAMTEKRRGDAEARRYPQAGLELVRNIRSFLIASSDLVLVVVDARAYTDRQLYDECIAAGATAVVAEADSWAQTLSLRLDPKCFKAYEYVRAPRVRARERERERDARGAQKRASPKGSPKASSLAAPAASRFSLVKAHPHRLKPLSKSHSPAVTLNSAEAARPAAAVGPAQGRGGMRR